jgi:hypothetical protein
LLYFVFLTKTISPSIFFKTNQGLKFGLRKNIIIARKLIRGQLDYLATSGCFDFKWNYANKDLSKLETQLLKLVLINKILVNPLMPNAELEFFFWVFCMYHALCIIYLFSGQKETKMGGIFCHNTYN